MAIKLTYVSPKTKKEVKDAYLRIEMVRFTKEVDAINPDNLKGVPVIKFNLVAYKDEETLEFIEKLNNIEVPTGNYKFTPDVSETADNFLQQSYNYLKTLDFFKQVKDQ